MIPCLSTRKRLACISIGLFFLFALLIVQFFKIQIIEGKKWTAQARAQHQLVVIEPFKRGLFYSNTSLKLGHPESPQAFVIDVPKFHLYADPQAIPRVRAGLGRRSGGQRDHHPRGRAALAQPPSSSRRALRDRVGDGAQLPGQSVPHLSAKDVQRLILIQASARLLRPAT